MTSAFRSVLESLRLSRDGVQPSIQTFPPVDIQTVSRELRLKELAESSAKNEIPHTADQDPDSAELDIRSEVETRARKAAEDFRSQMSLYEGRIRRALITHDQRVPIEAAAQNAFADFEAQTVDDLNHLAVLKSSVEGHQQEFDHFRSAHGLWRLPRIITPAGKLTRWLVLAIILVLESVINGTLFAEGSTRGLIGGVIYAIAFAALNIGGAYLCARFALPYIRYRGFVGKAWGILGTMIWVTWLIILNLALAHFRDLFVRAAATADRGVLVPWEMWLTQMLQSPITGIVESNSIVLGMLGIALGLAALVDASGLDDPYPGYGEVGRRREFSIESYAEAQSFCIARLKDRRNEAVSDMTAVIGLVRESEYDLRLALEGRERLHQNYAAFLESLRTAQERLIREYREENKKHRETAPPAFFRESIKPPAYLQPEPLAAMRELSEDTRSGIVALMERYIREINDGYRDALPRYASVADLTEVTESNAAA